MTDILFNKVRQKVLGLLYGHPDKDFYTNEIIRFTKTGTGAVQRELDKLSSSGLLTVTQSGNKKCYQANKSSPIYEELRSIILKTFGLADILREALEPLNSKIVIAFIYGSIAKHEDTANSDIDILIIGEDLTYADFFKIFQETEKKLGREINPTFYTPTQWKKKSNSKNHFVTQLIQLPKIFLKGTENELREIREPT